MCSFSLAGEGLGNRSLKQVTKRRESGKKPQHTGIIHPNEGIALVLLLLICFKKTWGERRERDFFLIKFSFLTKKRKKGKKERKKSQNFTQTENSNSARLKFSPWSHPLNGNGKTGEAAPFNSIHAPSFLLLRPQPRQASRHGGLTTSSRSLPARDPTANMRAETHTSAPHDHPAKREENYLLNAMQEVRFARKSFDSVGHSSGFINNSLGAGVLRVRGRSVVWAASPPWPFDKQESFAPP